MTPECRKTRLRASILQKIFWGGGGGMPPDPPSMGRLRGSCLRQPCGLHPQIWKPPSSNPGSATAVCPNSIVDAKMGVL